jgi:hypothetical protein
MDALRPEETGDKVIQGDNDSRRDNEYDKKKREPPRYNKKDKDNQKDKRSLQERSPFFAWRKSQENTFTAGFLPAPRITPTKRVNSLSGIMPFFIMVSPRGA